MTIEEAEKLFKEYNCNLFNLSRSEDCYLENYYKMLNISNEQEKIWTEEFIIEQCDMIINNKEIATQLYSYIKLYDVIYILQDSKNFDLLCKKMIEILDYATINLNPYCRINLVDYIINKQDGHDDKTLFINLLYNMKNIDLIEKYNKKILSLLDMSIENTQDFFDEKYRDRIFNQYESQYNDIKSGNNASRHDNL